MSNGACFVGLTFGILFTAGGLLLVYMAIISISTKFGVDPTHSDGAISEQSWWRTSAAVVGASLLGFAHLVIGSLMLTTLRCSIDRASRMVTVRYGWLGLGIRKAQLSQFHGISVFPTTRWFHQLSGVATFDIALVGPDNNRLIVGFATHSAELARDVAMEISQFTGLRMA